jgi:hypothetical protein
MKKFIILLLLFTTILTSCSGREEFPASISLEDLGEGKTFGKDETISLKVYIGNYNFMADSEVVLLVSTTRFFLTKEEANDAYYNYIENGFDITYDLYNNDSLAFRINIATVKITDFKNEKYRIKKQNQMLTEYIEVNFEVTTLESHGDLNIDLVKSKEYPTSYTGNSKSIHYEMKDDSIIIRNETWN